MEDKLTNWLGNNLMNGDIDRFAIDKLVQMLSRAGMDVQVLVTPKAS